MSKMIQIRNVPDELHRKLKVRAASLGMSLSDYLLSEIEEIAELPTLDEWFERVLRGKRRHFEVDTATLIREEREARDARFDRR